MSAPTLDTARPPSRRARLRGSSLWTIAGLVMSRGFVAVAGFGSSVLWARSFDQDTYGRFQIALAAVAVVSSFTLSGLNDAALISAAKRKDGNLAPILRLRLIASIMGALVVAGWGVVRYRADTTMMLAFFVSAVLFVPMQLQPIWQAFTNGKRQFRMLTIGQITIAAAGVLGIGAFVAAGATAPAMLPWAILGSQGVAAAVGVVFLFQLRGLVDNRDQDPTIVAYGHHVTAALLLSWVFSSDRLIVGEMMSHADVALLSIALVLPNQVKVFFTAFEQVFLPQVTEATSVAAAWDYIKPRIVRLWAAYTALGVVGFVLMPIGIELFFSHKYVLAVPYAKWLWLSLCLSSPFTFLASILNSQRDKRFLYVKNLASPAITIALFALLIPRYGLAGAVAGRIANHGLLVVLHVAYFARAVRRSRAMVADGSGPANRRSGDST